MTRVSAEVVDSLSFLPLLCLLLYSFFFSVGNLFFTRRSLVCLLITCLFVLHLSVPKLTANLYCNNFSFPWYLLCNPYFLFFFCFTLLILYLIYEQEIAIFVSLNCYLFNIFSSYFPCYCNQFVNINLFKQLDWKNDDLKQTLPESTVNKSC